MHLTFRLHGCINPKRVDCLYAGFHSNRRVAPQWVLGAEKEHFLFFFLWRLWKPTASNVLVFMQLCRNVARPVRMSYLTGVKLEKSAQPVSELELAGGEALHAASGRASVEEVEDDKGEEAAGLLGLAAEAVDVPVSMGMSSKLAVHTGPAVLCCNTWK